jgi:predicted TIM-barrel fold metal-dependent hydrolase
MVIDCHTHVGSHLGADGINRPDPSSLSADYDTRTEVMDENGIDRAVILPTYTYDKRDGATGTRALNDRLRELAAQYERFCCAIGTVEPLHGDAALDELERMSDVGFRGVSWHHKYQGAAIDDPTTIACLERAAELDLVPFIHGYQLYEAENFDYLKNALDHTDQPVVVLDSLTSAPNVRRALELGREYENVYFDTAMLYSLDNVVEQFVDELGADRLLFGTAFYSNPLQYRRSATLFQVESADISERDRQRILGDNVSELLGL